MSDNIFQSKSKADLVQIVRVSGVMPISQAQRMKKKELAEFLAQQMSEANQAPADGKGNEMPDGSPDSSDSRSARSPRSSSTRSSTSRLGSQRTTSQRASSQRSGSQRSSSRISSSQTQNSTTDTDNEPPRRSHMKSAPPEAFGLIPEVMDHGSESEYVAPIVKDQPHNTELEPKVEEPATEYPVSKRSSQIKARAPRKNVASKNATTRTTRRGNLDGSSEADDVSKVEGTSKTETFDQLDFASAVVVVESASAKEASESASTKETVTAVEAANEETGSAVSTDVVEDAPVETVETSDTADDAGNEETTQAEDSVDDFRPMTQKFNRRNSKQRNSQTKKPVSFQPRYNQAQGQSQSQGTAQGQYQNQNQNQNYTRSERALPKDQGQGAVEQEPEITEGIEFSARPRQRQLPMVGKAALAEKKTQESIGQDGDFPETENQAPVETKIELARHTGVLEMMPDGYGFLRSENYIQGPADVYVSAQIIRRFSLRAGDLVTGTCRNKRDQDRYQALNYIEEVNGLPPAKMHHRPHFDRLTPIYPTERYTLETDRKELATRIIDLFSPIGKGQRGMIVSPPKAGKTILLQKIANAISINNPDAKLIVLLIDERPEEVTDMQRRINGEVVYSTFDKTPENHVKITELVLERAKRLVELGQDVVILLDSMTRMARAYNLTITPTGRTLSGGLDPGALYHPKRFFGAARNIENGGSLTIVATSLVETGSRMDEVIFEEFKGTGNMEVLLDRKLSEKRIFPAIDINKSGTRREELLLTSKQLEAVWGVRKAFGQLDTANVTELIINLLLKTKDNDHMIESLNISLKDQAVIDAMRLPQESGNGKNQGYNR